MTLAKDVALTKKEEENIRKGRRSIDKLLNVLQHDKSVLQIHHMLKDADKADRSIKKELLRCQRLVVDEETTLRELHTLYDNTMAQVRMFIKRPVPDEINDKNVIINNLLAGIRKSVNATVTDERYWESRERKLKRLLRKKSMSEKEYNKTVDLLWMQLRTLYSLMRRYDVWIRKDRDEAKLIERDVRAIKKTVSTFNIPDRHTRVHDHREEVISRLDKYLSAFRVLERKMTQEEHEAHLRGIVKLYHKVAAKRAA